MDSFETLLPPADQETARKGSYHDYLQQRLRTEAESRISNTFVKLTNTFLHYGPELVQEDHNAYMTDHVLDFKTLYDLKATGLLDTVTQVPIRQMCEAETVLGPTKIERLDAHRFGLKLGDLEKALKVRADLRERMDRSEVILVIQEAIQNHVNGVTDVNTGRQFSLDHEPLTNAVVFSALNMFGYSDYYYDYVPGQDPDEFALKKLSQGVADAANFDRDGYIINAHIPVARGVTMVLTPVRQDLEIDDISNAGWNLSFITSPEEYMVERANQQENTTCEVFINRPTGRAFIDALEASHLRFSSGFEDFLSFKHTYTFEDRYGGPYAQLTRVLAKIIWSQDLDKLKDIIRSENGEPVTSQNIESFVNHLSADNGLLVFQKLLRQIMTRDTNDIQSDIPVTRKRISISAGACFDVYGYYIDAQSSRMLQAVDIEEKPFLEKTLGAHTFINAKPIKFNGVDIPKGGLFVDDESGSYAFLRLTPFTFDDRDDMLSTFGTEVLKGDDKIETYQRILQRMKLISDESIN